VCKSSSSISRLVKSCLSPPTTDIRTPETAPCGRRPEGERLADPAGRLRGEGLRAVGGGGTMYDTRSTGQTPSSVAASYIKREQQRCIF